MSNQTIPNQGWSADSDMGDEEVLWWDLDQTKTPQKDRFLWSVWLEFINSDSDLLSISHITCTSSYSHVWTSSLSFRMPPPDLKMKTNTIFDDDDDDILSNYPKILQFYTINWLPNFLPLKTKKWKPAGTGSFQHQIKIFPLREKVALRNGVGTSDQKNPSSMGFSTTTTENRHTKLASSGISFYSHFLKVFCFFFIVILNKEDEKERMIRVRY